LESNSGNITYDESMWQALAIAKFKKKTSGGRNARPGRNDKKKLKFE
jgi:hypothetical protein